MAELNARIAQALENAARSKRSGSPSGQAGFAQGDELLTQAVDVKGLKVLAAALPGADAKTLRDTMDKLKDKLSRPPPSCWPPWTATRCSWPLA